jgi:hypothetical protein
LAEAEEDSEAEEEHPKQAQVTGGRPGNRGEPRQEKRTARPPPEDPLNPHVGAVYAEQSPKRKARQDHDQWEDPMAKAHRAFLGSGGGEGVVPLSATILKILRVLCFALEQIPSIARVALGSAPNPEHRAGQSRGDTRQQGRTHDSSNDFRDGEDSRCSGDAEGTLCIGAFIGARITGVVLG